MGNSEFCYPQVWKNSGGFDKEIESYGAKCVVVSDMAWDSNHLSAYAFSKNCVVYIREKCDIEIGLAMKAGRLDIAEKLEKLKLKELSRYDEHPTENQ